MSHTAPSSIQHLDDCLIAGRRKKYNCMNFIHSREFYYATQEVMKKGRTLCAQSEVVKPHTVCSESPKSKKATQRVAFSGAPNSHSLAGEKLPGVMIMSEYDAAQGETTGQRTPQID